MKDIEKKLMNRLKWNDQIDSEQIEITMKEGVVTLKGCVSSYPEKVLAEIECKMVPETNSVINDIEVILPDLEEIPSDNDLKEAMYCLLDANSEINSNDVNVSIDNGKVILDGKVNSYWKSYSIKKMASQISGVISVVNNISIQPDKKISDDEISKSIKIAMQKSVHVDANEVNLEIQDGKVMLSGTLHSKSEYEAVLKIIRTTKGVLEINNNLKFILQYDTT